MSDSKRVGRTGAGRQMPNDYQVRTTKEGFGIRLPNGWQIDPVPRDPIASPAVVFRAWAGEYGAARGLTTKDGEDDGRPTFDPSEKQDAFRHAFVMGAHYLDWTSRVHLPAMAREDVAVFQSLMPGYLNEVVAANPLDQHLMDYWNNYEGIKLAREAYKIHGERITNDLFADYVAEKVLESAALPPGKGRFIHDSMNDARAKKIELFEAERLPPKNLRPPIVEEAFKDIFERLDTVPEGDLESPAEPGQTGALSTGRGNGLTRTVEHIIPTRSMIDEGSEGAPVAEIQRFLNARAVTGADGKTLPVNGILDNATRTAVEAYQTRHPTLLRDGIVGLRTLTAMLRDEGSARRPVGAKATIAAGGSSIATPAASDKAGDRALQLALELGEALGRGLMNRHSSAEGDLNFGFKSSPETGAIDPDALEVSTAIKVPHSVDRGLPWAARERDVDIIYTALRGSNNVTQR